MSYVDLTGLDRTDFSNTAGGRNPFKDGPTNGNWGGKNWSGGLGPNQFGPPAPPKDSGDAQYENHDLCYDCCKGDKSCMYKCDDKLRSDLNTLPNNPINWPMPPRPGSEGQSNRFKKGALWWFSRN